MKEYKALIRISAECEDDFKEQLEALDGFCDTDLEWWCEVSGYCAECEKEIFKESEAVAIKPSRLDELEQKAWEHMTGEDVADNLDKEEAEEYYKLLGQ